MVASERLPCSHQYPSFKDAPLENLNEDPTGRAQARGLYYFPGNYYSGPLCLRWFGQKPILRTGVADGLRKGDTDGLGSRGYDGLESGGNDRLGSGGYYGLGNGGYYGLGNRVFNIFLIGIGLELGIRIRFDIWFDLG